MKKRIKTLQELSDSKLLFDKKPPSFGYFFISIFGVLMMLLIIFAIKTPKIYVIKANGIVTSRDSNFVMCSYTGEIDQCFYQEGDLLEKGNVIFTVKSTDYDLQYKQLTIDKDNLKSKIIKYETLVKSIKDDTNYFESGVAEDELYFSSFEKYKDQVEQAKVDANSYKAYGYTDEQIEVELIKNQSKITEIYHTAIQTAESTKNDLNMQIESIDSKIQAIEGGQSAYEVRATASGVLHLNKDYKSGVVVQTTETVGTITPANDEKVIVTYVSTADMARMKVGNKVQIAVDGLAQNVYGTLQGVVLSIDSDVTVRQGADGASYQMFKVLIGIDNDYVISRSGDKVNIQNGMTTEARIQYDKVTYMNYMLEKIGLKVK